MNTLNILTQKRQQGFGKGFKLIDTTLIEFSITQFGKQYFYLGKVFTPVGPETDIYDHLANQRLDVTNRQVP